MVCLAIAYLSISAVALFEKKYPVSLYFVAAFLITMSVLWMQK